jgi:hypothetical protein
MKVTVYCRLKNKTATPLPHSTTTTERILGGVVIAAFALLCAHIAVGFFLP